jgi:hypothetical protein
MEGTLLLTVGWGTAKMAGFEFSQVVREGKVLGSDEGKAKGCALSVERTSAWSS